MKQPSSPADPAAPGEEPASAKTREVAPGVFEIFLPLPSKPTIINVWLVDCGGPWALIDTGVALQTSRDALAGALASLGITPSSVTHLLATHHHPDHFGASRPLRAESGCRVYIHPAELERIDYALHAGPEERAGVASIIALHKELRPLLHTGEVVRIAKADPKSDDSLAALE